MKKLRFALLFLGLIHAAAAAPLPDWIKSGLTADLGTWSQAPAVVVYNSHLARFTTADHIIETSRIVIRIGTVAGRHHAAFGETFRPGTEKILNASAWVMGRDGQIQKTYKRNAYTEDFATYDSVTWDNDRILSLDLSSQVELGGYVAFEIEQESVDPIHEVSHFLSNELPYVVSTLEVIPPAGLALQSFATLIPEIAPTPGDAPGSLRWTVGRTDKKTEDAPEGFVPKMHAIMVRCARPAGSPMDQSSWASLAGDISGVFAPALKADQVLRAKATELTAGKTDRWSRIRALCEFAQRDIRYIHIRLGSDYLSGYRPHGAAEVLKNRYGDCKDKASLLVAMLDVIGERAHMIVVNSGNPKAVLENWPSPKWFNHAIVGIAAAPAMPDHWPVSDAGALGRIVIFDPTDPVTPLGVLSASDQGGWGLVAAGKDGGIVRLPREAPAQNSTRQQINAKLDPDLLLKIHVNTVSEGSGGSESYAQRLMLGDVEFGRTIEARLHQSLAYVDNFKWTDAWDGVASRHTIDLRFSTRSYAKPLGTNRVIVQPGILGLELALPKINQLDGHIDIPAWQKKRTTSLKLPPEWTVADLPKSAQAEGKYLFWDISYSYEDGKLLSSVVISQKPLLADPVSYEEIRRERQQLHELLRRPAVLRHVATVDAAKSGE